VMLVDRAKRTMVMKSTDQSTDAQFKKRAAISGGPFFRDYQPR